MLAAAKEGILTQEDLSKGFNDVLDLVPDVSIDVPQVRCSAYSTCCRLLLLVFCSFPVLCSYLCAYVFCFLFLVFCFLPSSRLIY